MLLFPLLAYGIPVGQENEVGMGGGEMMDPLFTGGVIRQPCAGPPGGRSLPI
jgi:hypothetical protein